MALSPRDEEQTADQTASGTAHFAIAHPVRVGVMRSDAALRRHAVLEPLAV